MQIRKIKSVASLAVLGLMTMLSSGCAHGPAVSTDSKAQPTASYLADLANEYSTATYGPATREVVKDWVAQNEPDDKEKDK